MLWFRKFITFILLATGIALQFLQFPVSLAGERIKKMLILEIENTPYTRLSAAKRFGADFIELSYERLSHQPEVREVFSWFDGQIWRWVCFQFPMGLFLKHISAH